MRQSIQTMRLDHICFISENKIWPLSITPEVSAFSNLNDTGKKGKNALNHTMQLWLAIIPRSLPKKSFKYLYLEIEIDYLLKQKNSFPTNSSWQWKWALNMTVISFFFFFGFHIVIILAAIMITYTILVFFHVRTRIYWK